MEEQILEALRAIADKAEGGYDPFYHDGILAAIAPRVAAAIEVVAKNWAADVEHEYGGGRVPGGDRYEDTLGRARDEAFAALRGEG